MRPFCRGRSSKRAFGSAVLRELSARESVRCAVSLRPDVRRRRFRRRACGCRGCRQEERATNNGVKKGAACGRIFSGVRRDSRGIEEPHGEETEGGRTARLALPAVRWEPIPTDAHRCRLRRRFAGGRAAFGRVGRGGRRGNGSGEPLPPCSATDAAGETRHKKKKRERRKPLPFGWWR